MRFVFLCIRHSFIFCPLTYFYGSDFISHVCVNVLSNIYNYISKILEINYLSLLLPPLFLSLPVSQCCMMESQRWWGRIVTDFRPSSWTVPYISLTGGSYRYSLIQNHRQGLLQVQTCTKSLTRGSYRYSILQNHGPWALGGTVLYKQVAFRIIHSIVIHLYMNRNQQFIMTCIYYPFHIPKI